jgi:hypothetical protein
MQDEQWNNLIDNLELKFGKLERKHQTAIQTDDIGHEIKNREEWVEFETPMGKMKLSRVTRPMIVDKKVHYTHTGGSKGKVEYILSENEFSHKVTLYNWNKLRNEWQEMELPSGGIKF